MSQPLLRTQDRYIRLAPYHAVPVGAEGEALPGEPAALSPAEADVPAGALELRWRELARRTRAYALTLEGAAEAERQVNYQTILGLLQGCVEPVVASKWVLRYVT